MTSAGEITLNYVSPAARFRGISKRLLQQLEAEALTRGNTRVTLTGEDGTTYEIKREIK